MLKLINNHSTKHTQKYWSCLRLISDKEVSKRLVWFQTWHTLFKTALDFWEQSLKSAYKRTMLNWQKIHSHGVNCWTKDWGQVLTSWLSLELTVLLENLLMQTNMWQSMVTLNKTLSIDLNSTKSLLTTSTNVSLMRPHSISCLWCKTRCTSSCLTFLTLTFKFHVNLSLAQF